MNRYSVFKTFIFFAIATTGALFAKNLSVKNEALFNAVKSRSIKQVKNIVKYGVSINELDQNNKTALDIAVERGYKKIARFLLKQGGRVTSETNAHTLKGFLKDRAFGFLLG